MPQLKVTLVKSLIDRPKDQKATAKALGLIKLNRSITVEPNLSLLGMIKKISHLVTVEEVNGTGAQPVSAKSAPKTEAKPKAAAPKAKKAAESAQPTVQHDQQAAADSSAQQPQVEDAAPAELTNVDRPNPASEAVEAEQPEADKEN